GLAWRQDRCPAAAARHPLLRDSTARGEARGRGEGDQSDGSVAERRAVLLDDATGFETRAATHAPKLSEQQSMSDQQDLFTAHYRTLRRDAGARRRLIENPIDGLKEHFGSIPG